eukprot:3562344-Rhodomonas_salina.2
MEGKDGEVHNGVKLGGSENLVQNGVLDNAKTKTAVITEMGLRMDNDEGAIEERAEEKEAKYRASRVLLQAGLRRERGLAWRARHVSFIAGWKTLLNKNEWGNNLPLLGIPVPKHKSIMQVAVEVVLRAFRSM